MKILFSDFDGTLAADDKSVTKEDYDALKYLNERGGKFVLCTGRMTESAKRISALLPFKPLIAAFNGGEIIDFESGKEFGLTLLTAKDGEELARFGEENGFVCHLYTDSVLTEKPNEYTENYCKAVLCPPKYLGIKPSEYIKNTGYRTPKVQYAEGREFIEQKIAAVRAKFGARFEIMNIEKTKIDISPKGITKGYALEKICSFFGIDERDAVAVGDDENDIPMIEKAGVGVAVNNAISRLKAVSDYVTTRNNGGAVAEVIYKYF